MEHFSLEYFILLTEDELYTLVTAKNRDDFQPELKGFLYATKRLKELRQLAFASGLHEWIPPVLMLNESSEIVDNKSKIRGHRVVIPLPPRPGEPQMAVSYDWFWEEFSTFLINTGRFPVLQERQIIVYFDQNSSFQINSVWDDFLRVLGSEESINRNMGYYFRAKKMIYKQRGPKAPTTAKAWDNDVIPIFSESLRKFLMNYYENISSAEIKYFQDGQATKALEKLRSLRTYESVEFPGISDFEGRLKPGDNATSACAGCGKSFKRQEKKYKRISAFLKDADERPQSGTNKETKPCYCKLCALQVMICPLKFTNESLSVRFIANKQNNKKHIAKPLIEQELRKHTAQSLHIHAGSFVSLHLTERVEKRKLLCNAWGAYHYALWKMAVTFPPELFAQGFSVEVYPGEETFRLPRWSVWFVSSLAAWDGVFRYNCYGKKGFRPHFAQFLRLVSHKKIFQAFYVLISGGLIKNYAQSWRINQLQDIWKEFETILKEDNMPIPDYPRIVGFAGLLLPLAERLQTSRKPENEKKRALTKLLEEVNRPIQYAYTAARESGSTDFIFCQRPCNRYFFEKAMELLEWSGEDVTNLKKEAERIVNEQEAFSWAKDAEQKVFICSDQILRVTSALVNENQKPYENEADWRAFAYQVKLALWSMFPRYLGSQD